MNATDRIFLHPWSILPTAVPQLLSMLDIVMKGLHSEAPRQEDWLAQFVHQRPPMQVDDGIATIHMTGPLGKKLTRIEKRLGATDYDDLTADFETAMENSRIRGIHLVVDSPGGSVVGAPEAREIVQMAGLVKPVVASIATVGASAAYMIAAGANAIVASRSAIVGSIGTIAYFADWSQFYERMGIRMSLLTAQESDLKATWHPLAPMTDEQRADAQRQLDEANADFLAWVHSRRTVPDSAMRGQWFNGDQALHLGLVDMVGNRPIAAIRALIRLEEHDAPEQREKTDPKAQLDKVEWILEQIESSIDLS